MINSIYREKLKLPEEAIGLIASGMRLTIPLCCGMPQTLISALVQQKARLKDVEIVSGLQISYPFLGKGLEDSFSYRTWQCSPPIREYLKNGTVKYIPMRQGDAVDVFGKRGCWPIDAALIQVSLPDNDGYMSLGVSIGHALPLAREARLVIAEVNQRMPMLFGDCSIHISEVDAIVESDRALLNYNSKDQSGEKETAIGNLVAELIPNGANLQVGIGAIPSAVLAALKDKKGIGFFGMGVDGIVDLYESNAMEPISRKRGAPCVLVTETLGTEKIFSFIDKNPLVEGYPIPRIINAREAGRLDKFVSIISAIEIDLFGQVNSETVFGKQISAIGGSFDFLEGAHFSREGKSIIAMTSTSPDNKHSRIVPDLPLGSAVTIPRHCVNFVVTEYGIADLYGKTLAERGKALIAISHPDFREELEKALKEKKVGI
jgi:4-hydroxybutyrate CoA-transferase